MIDTGLTINEYGRPVVEKTKTSSTEINELIKALARAQGIMETAKKRSENPNFKSTYADLAMVWGACRKPLSDNGLAVLQPTRVENGVLFVTTILAHESGQWMSGELSVPLQSTDPQTLGSCISYLRRYGLATLVGVTAEDEDDDAEKAMEGYRTESSPEIPMPKKKEPAIEKPKTDSPTRLQLKKLQGLFEKIGYQDKEARSKKAKELLGVSDDINSSKELTQEQAHRLIELLEKEISGG